MSSSLPSSGPSENSTTLPKSPVDNMLLSPPHAQTEPDFPEGGTAAWCTALGVFLAQFCGFGYTNAFGVYQAFYTQHYLQNESPSAISWIESLAAFLLTGMGPICGRLFDNGYFYHVFITGAVLQSLSIFMLSLVQPGQYYQIFLAQGLTCGIGLGLIYVPSFAILSHHFKRRRAIVIAIVNSGVPLGGIVNTIMLNKLLNGPIGFRMGVRINATFITVLLFLSCILVRPRYGAVRQEATPVNFWKATKKCFTELPSLSTIIGFTLFHVAYVYPFVYFQIDSLKHGLGDSLAFYSSVLIDAGGFIGHPLAGAVLPFVSAVDLTIITIIICAILIIGMIWLSSAASVVVLGLLYGVFSGMNIAVMAPMLALTSNPGDLGVRMGVGFAITGIGGLVGPPICGALLTDRYTWWAPGLFCGAIALVSAVLFVYVRLWFARAGSGSPPAKPTSSEGEGSTGSESEKKKAVEA